MMLIWCKITTDPELLIAFIALITSFIAILIGTIGLFIQRRHNQKSVMPIGTINLADYENKLKIRISNKGVGPMIIRSCNTKGKSESKPYPIDWMPKQIIWDTFRRDLENHALSAGESLTLLELSIDSNNETETIVRDRIRLILKDLKMTVAYTDIYGNKFKASRIMDWFGRNIS